ncbi:MAG: PQQ-like beta-propeller repeat protein, partial [Opitutaceae bacterium]|nr:PQQ-like beta-propeller repeat protein [Opitutaceae bacterium]
MKTRTFIGGRFVARLGRAGIPRGWRREESRVLRRGLLLAACATLGANAADLPQPFPELKFHAAPRALAAGATVEDWPHFLGPRLDATTHETKLIDRWPAGGPKLVWEMARGEGYACPTIAEGRLVYFHRVGERETVDCLDPETGKRFWRFDYPVAYEDRYGFSPGPRASAVIQGGRVFVAGVTALLHCLDLKAGAVVWKRDLRADYGVPSGFFGYGPTPCVWRDKLIVTVGGKNADGGSGVAVAALDQATGKTAWTTVDAWGADYASPIVATIRGREVVLAVVGGESRPAVGGLLTIDPSDGRVLDRFAWRARIYESVIAGTAFAVDDRRVFISECYEKGGVLLEFDEQMKSRPVWTQRDFGLHWMAPARIGGHLYGFAGRNPPDTELRCVDLATGKVAWRDDTRFEEGGRVQSFFRGTLLSAGSRVFALGEDGLLAELELSPKGMAVRQRTRLFGATSTWTLPALHRGLLYVAQNER